MDTYNNIPIDIVNNILEFLLSLFSDFLIGNFVDAFCQTSIQRCYYINSIYNIDVLLRPLELGQTIK